MRIAQISDLHYRRAGTRLFGAVDAHQGAVRAVAWLNAFRPSIDAVIITGDLVNDGGSQDYAALKAVLDQLAMPYRVLPGNHDTRALVVETFGTTETFGAIGSALAGQKYVWDWDLGPVRIVGLDTLVEGEHHGEVGAAQLDWLDGVLGTGTKPTLVALHHPPFATGIGFMDGIAMADRDALAAVIARHGHVSAILCGHVHRTIQTRFAGTLAMIAPGTAHQVALDLHDAAPPRWTFEPPGALLHLWTGDSFIHHMTLFDFPGSESPFSDHHTVAPPQS
ncbi:MAG: phosphodiesterase [Pseudomonadota bacterium]